MDCNISTQHGKARQFKEFDVNVGRRVKAKRLELKLTRERLSCKAQISDKFLYEIERGGKGMSAETLYKVAHALGVSADWLLGE